MTDRLRARCRHHRDSTTEESTSIRRRLKARADTLRHLSRIDREADIYSLGCACQGTGWIVIDYIPGEDVEINVPGYGWLPAHVERRHKLDTGELAGWDVRWIHNYRADYPPLGYRLNLPADHMRLAPCPLPLMEQTDSQFALRRQEAVEQGGAESSSSSSLRGRTKTWPSSQTS